MSYFSKKKYFKVFKNIMIINNYYSPSFGAKFLNKIKIDKYNQPKDKYDITYVSFVEIEPNNRSDIKALYENAKYWEDAKYADDIYNAACEMRDNNIYYNKNHIYALTTQNSNFEELNADAILGITNIRETGDNSMFIENLQVHPNIVYRRCANYRGVGTGILNSLKKICNMITLFSAKEKSVQDFYKRNDFFEYPPDSNIYVWIKNIFDR